MDSNDRRVAYQQEWENFRYQDKLRWSRFQTLAVIEGAYLVALYQLELDPWRGLVWAVVATGLVAAVSLMAVKDANDARAHIRQVEKLSAESEMDLPSFKKAPSVFGMRGYMMMLIALWLLNLFNVAVIVDQLLRIRA